VKLVYRIFAIGLIFTHLTFPVWAQDAEKGGVLYKTCVQCHGSNGQGNVEKVAPKIAGQYDWYIVASIKAFQKGIDRKNPTMLPYIKNLSETDINDLAAHISKL
jgi:cytochrome c553